MRRLWLWGPPAGFMVALFWASSQPDLTAMPGGMSDKTLHFAAYFVLAVLCQHATAGGRWSGIHPRSALAAFAIAAGYGAFDEFHQMLTPGRFPSVADWVADALGAAAALGLGLLVAALVRRLISSRDV
jgi:VanZ family protein